MEFLITVLKNWSLRSMAEANGLKVQLYCSLIERSNRARSDSETHSLSVDSEVSYYLLLGSRGNTSVTRQLSSDVDIFWL